MLGRLAEEASPPRVVQQADGTPRASEYVRPAGEKGWEGDPKEGVDALFGDSAAYVRVKKERPQHRLMLWMRLNGHKPKEIAAMLGVTPQTVYNVEGQPWFQEAFCRLSQEMGKDAVQTFLQGEVLPAVQRISELAKMAESEPVRLAANNALIDRFLGKPAVHVKQEISGQVDNVVYDAAKLLEEQRRNEAILRSRGIGTN